MSVLTGGGVVGVGGATDAFALGVAEGLASALGEGAGARWPSMIAFSVSRCQ